MPSLKPKQEIGVEFLLNLDPRLNNKPHKLLAWDMGTGKTHVACAAMKRDNVRSALIVCPKSVKQTWRHWLIEWGVFRADRILIIESGEDVKYAEQYLINNYDCIIINYELAITTRAWKLLTLMAFDLTLFDEAHRCSNMLSKTSSRLMGGHKTGSPNLIETGYHRWLLTGTPSRNGRPMELFPFLKVLAPECLGEYNDYGKYGHRFCGGEHQAFRGATNIDELNLMLQPFMSVMTLDEMYPDMPPFIYEDVYMDIGDMLHDRTNTNSSTLWRVTGEQKYPYVIEYLKDRIDTDKRKLLIFIQHKEVGIELASQLHGLLVNGDTTQKKRDQIFQRFADTMSYEPLIAQSSILSEGFDGLQYHCNEIVNVEGGWVPDSQAVARLRRTGQCKQVIVTRIIAENTINEPMGFVEMRKKQNIKSLIKETKDMSIEQSLERIAVALETIAGNGNAPSAKPATSKPEKVAKDANATIPADTAPSVTNAATVTEDQIRAAVTDLIGSYGTTDEETAPGYDAARAIWSKYGATKLAEVKPENRASALADVQTALAARKVPKANKEI